MDNSVDMVDNLQQKKIKKGALGIFAKQPIPGQVKTRLSPPLTLEDAAALYRESLFETIERLQQGAGYDLVLCYSGSRSWFEEHFPGIPLQKQKGKTLGERMATALQAFLDQGFSGAALVGSDSPDLPLSAVEDAFSALQTVDLVLGPADDGGYYLVGESKHHPELFTDIPWSSAEVFEATLEKAKQGGLSVRHLEPWEDLDDIAALCRYRDRNNSGRTLRFIKGHLAHMVTEP